MKNNDLKLLVVDIDGTLVNEPREMMPITRAVLNDLHNRGILLGIASGRPIGEHLYAQKDGWNLNFDFDFQINFKYFKISLLCKVHWSCNTSVFNFLTVYSAS